MLDGYKAIRAQCIPQNIECHLSLPGQTATYALWRLSCELHVEVTHACGGFTKPAQVIAQSTNPREP
jgi:hypothetical protein